MLRITSTEDRNLLLNLGNIIIPTLKINLPQLAFPPTFPSRRYLLYSNYFPCLLIDRLVHHSKTPIPHLFKQFILCTLIHITTLFYYNCYSCQSILVCWVVWFV